MSGRGGVRRGNFVFGAGVSEWERGQVAAGVLQVSPHANALPFGPGMLWSK